jgi:DnaK suppressor protein
MTKSELNRYKGVLEAKQAELSHMIRNRDSIAIEKCADALDEVQYPTGRELAIRRLDRDSNPLRNVRAALGRIEEGSFGVCLNCEEDISPRRLAVVPSTVFCIVCQEIADRSQYYGAQTLDELLLVAA